MGPGRAGVSEFKIRRTGRRSRIVKPGPWCGCSAPIPADCMGRHPNCSLYDEVAQWPPGARRADAGGPKDFSRGKIPGSKALWLGTRPSAADHPFQRALDGHGVGFALCYAAPKDAPPFRRSTWKRANPGLDHLPDLGSRDPQPKPKTPNATSRLCRSFRALRLNQGVSDTTVSVLVDADTWRGAEALP